MQRSNVLQHKGEMEWHELREGGQEGGGRGLNSNMGGIRACLDVDLGLLPISIASNNGLGQHGNIHSGITLSCNIEQKVLRILEFQLAGCSV